MTLTSIQADTRFHIFAQGQQPCDANACVASGPSPVSFAALAQVTYMIVADTVSQGQAPNTVSMACDVTAEVCDTGVDDDLDNAVDCEDVDCKLVGDCGSNEICEDGEDNDLDGYTDCEDITCLDLPVCAASEDCTDGVDNDDDGYTDCQDNQCSVDPACGPN